MSSRLVADVAGRVEGSITVGRDGQPRPSDQDDVYRAVLDQEHRQLRQVDQVDDLHRWRDRLVTALARPESPYARALTGSSPTADDRHGPMTHAAFLSRWHTLLEEAIHRLQDRGEIAGRQPPGHLATAIVAAVHGGLLLARVTGDAGKLRNALRLPFDQFCLGRNASGSD